MQRFRAVSDEELALAADLGQRWAAALRRRYPANAEKLICRDFDVAAPTARGWLDGRTPQHRHIARAKELPGGEALIADVYLDRSLHQLVCEALVRLQEQRRELDRLHQAISRAEATLRR